MTFIMTRLGVGDFDVWKTMFDQDAPRARESALGYRIFRGAERSDEVFIQIEFASLDDAQAARERLLASGVLDRFADRDGPTVVELAETVTR